MRGRAGGSETSRPDARRFALLIALLAVAVGLTFAANAEAYIYWDSGNGGIGRANLDGSSPTGNFLNQGDGTGVAVDENFIYWSDSGSIGRANLDGSNPDPDFITGLVEDSCGLAVDSNYIYWGSPLVGTTIGRADIDGSDQNETFIDGANLPCGVAVDENYIYWSNLGNSPDTGEFIGRAELDGDAPDQNFIFAGDATATCGVAVNSESLFFGYRIDGEFEGTDIGRTDIDGTDLDSTFVPAMSPCMGDVDSNHIYWVNQFDPGSIGRAELDGDDAITNFITTGVDLPMFVTVDPFPFSTSLAASCSPGSVSIAQQTTCTVTASATTGDLSPTGTVTFSSAQGSFGSGGSCSLNNSGSAQSSCSLTYTPSTAGAGAISAALQASNKFTGSATTTSVDGTLPQLIGPVTRNPKKGTARLVVVAPAAGAIALTGQGVKGAGAQATGAGELTLPVSASGKAAKKLRRKGRAAVSPSVTFTSTGGISVTDNTTIVLAKRGRAK